jgi:hypothetical protein
VQFTARGCRCLQVVSSRGEGSQRGQGQHHEETHTGDLQGEAVWWKGRRRQQQGLSETECVWTALHACDPACSSCRSCQARPAAALPLFCWDRWCMHMCRLPAGQLRVLVHMQEGKANQHGCDVSQ